MVEIGNVVRRGDGKWHRVESVVAGAAITRCGRRMEPHKPFGQLEVSVTSEPSCKRCAS